MNFNSHNILNRVTHSVYSRLLFFLWVILTIFIIPFFLSLAAIINKCITKKNTYYFDFIANLFIKMTKIRHEYIEKNNIYINHGILLSNHRCWFDFPFDVHLTKCSLVSRKEAQYAMVFAGLLSYIENRVINFSRGKTSRELLYRKIQRYLEANLNTKVLIYPEGTRLKHTKLSSIEETKQKIKPGLIKSIYENNSYPVQIFLSKNKELVVDEKKLTCSSGVFIQTIICKEIHPKYFKTFDDFYNKIIDDWYISWNKLYN